MVISGFHKETSIPLCALRCVRLRLPVKASRPFYGVGESLTSTGMLTGTTLKNKALGF